jgi:hypothetical protein
MIFTVPQFVFLIFSVDFQFCCNVHFVFGCKFTGYNIKNDLESLWKSSFIVCKTMDVNILDYFKSNCLPLSKFMHKICDIFLKKKDSSHVLQT